MATRPRLPASEDVAPAGAVAPPASGTSSAPPAGLRVAAAAQAVEALGLLVAAVFAAIATVGGKSYERGSGIALTLIAVGVAAGLASFAVGLARARAWTRTPVVMTQLFIGGVGIYLVDGHRLEWAIPALALAALCLIGVFLPASLRALNRPSPFAAASVAETELAAADASTGSARTSQQPKAAKPQPTAGTGQKSRGAKPQPTTKPQPAAGTGQASTKTGQKPNAKNSGNRPPANRKRKRR